MRALLILCILVSLLAPLMAHEVYAVASINVHVSLTQPVYNINDNATVTVTISWKGLTRNYTGYAEIVKSDGTVIAQLGYFNFTVPSGSVSFTVVSDKFTKAYGRNVFFVRVYADDFLVYQARFEVFVRAPQFNMFITVTDGNSNGIIEVGEPVQFNVIVSWSGAKEGTSIELYANNQFIATIKLDKESGVTQIPYITKFDTKGEKKIVFSIRSGNSVLYSQAYTIQVFGTSAIDKFSAFVMRNWKLVAFVIIIMLAIVILVRR